MSCTMDRPPPAPPAPPAPPEPSSFMPASMSCRPALGSISMALRLVKPSMRRASLPNFCEKASDRLCAGSVEISSTLRRTLASWMASEHDVVVLPTPPLPPTKIQRSERWSRMDWRLGSMTSSSTLTTAAIIAGGVEVQRGVFSIKLKRVVVGIFVQDQTSSESRIEGYGRTETLQAERLSRSREWLTSMKLSIRLRTPFLAGRRLWQAANRSG